MAELLKYIYNVTFFETYCKALSKVIPSFDQSSFMHAFVTPHWEALELKQRMAYIGHFTSKLLPFPVNDKFKVILNLIEELRVLGVKEQNLEYIFLADIITEFGLNDLQKSIPVIEKVTQFVSFEFAGRAFIIKYPKEMMMQMAVWAGHNNENVRRFASEGCRPRLPWGTKLSSLVLDPGPCFLVLEKLINDPSLYVRKSVANHLNDISKDHPEKVVKFIKKYKGQSEHTDWILRHGARTLLKIGNEEVLHIFGTSKHLKYKLEQFKLEKKDLQREDLLSFSFSLTNMGDKAAVFRIEYHIWYVKAGGQHIKKIFKIAEKSFLPEMKFVFKKTHAFKDLTTRRHYPGEHKISIVINGNESEAQSFALNI